MDDTQTAKKIRSFLSIRRDGQAICRGTRRRASQQRAALHAKAKLKIGTLMESLIKEVSDRVQGTENFWNNPEGANQILAVKAAALSDDGRLLEAC